MLGPQRERDAAVAGRPSKVSVCVRRVVAIGNRFGVGVSEALRL